MTNLVLEGLFHHTPARRLFETSGEVLAACLGVAAGWWCMKRLPRVRVIKTVVDPRKTPPGAWIATSDKQTIRSVMSAVTAGFKMARERPKERQHDALREATFAVPYELAQLNKDDPDFKLENMGPLPPLPSQGLRITKNNSDSNESFDQQKDGRIFLYFPGGATKASAAFVAINAELSLPNPTQSGMVSGAPTSPDQKLITQASSSWIVRYMTWEAEKSDVMERIETGSFPVIFIFRDKTFGSLYDTNEKIFPELGVIDVLFGLVEEPTDQKRAS